MYVKSLSLRGFKSFASRTQLQFSPGIACIVGPNGSGKSNIVDALAWVMGEQGAKNLRGGQMTDVIFAGNQEKTAAARAQVELTIDNSQGDLPIDYSEVTISRTLLRSGGSEYAINGTPCRLLDIQELLSDTGMGRNMHVLVGQGQLDQVLSADPWQRRAMIEEAAGVLKHQRRKERALRKIEKMEDKLSRVQDLTREINRQLGPLARQAKTARKAARLQAQYRDAKARLLADDLQQMQTIVLEQGQRYQELKNQREALNQQVKQLSQEINQRQEQLAHSHVAARLSGQGQQLTGLVERFKSLQLLGEEKQKSLSEPLPAPDGPELGVRKQLVKEAQERLEQAEANLATIEHEVIQLTAKRQSHETTVEKLVQATTQARARAAEKAQENARLESIKQQAQVRLEALVEEQSRHFLTVQAQVKQTRQSLEQSEVFLQAELSQQLNSLLAEVKEEETLNAPQLVQFESALAVLAQAASQSEIDKLVTSLLTDQDSADLAAEDLSKTAPGGAESTGMGKETVGLAVDSALDTSLKPKVCATNSSNGKETDQQTGPVNSGDDTVPISNSDEEEDISGPNPYTRVYQELEEKQKLQRQVLSKLQKEVQSKQTAVGKQESRCEYLRQAQNRFSSAAQEKLQRNPDCLGTLAQLVTLDAQSAEAISVIFAGFEQAAVFADLQQAHRAVAALPAEEGNARWWVLGQSANEETDPSAEQTIKLELRRPLSSPVAADKKSNLATIEETTTDLGLWESPIPVVELIQAHPRLIPSLQDFLADWWLASDSEQALSLLAERGEQCPQLRVVTADGICWQRNYGQVSVFDPQSHLVVEEELQQALAKLDVLQTDKENVLARWQAEEDQLEQILAASRQAMADLEAENQRRAQIAQARAEKAAAEARIAAEKAAQEARIAAEKARMKADKLRLVTQRITELQAAWVRLVDTLGQGQQGQTKIAQAQVSLASAQREFQAFQEASSQVKPMTGTSAVGLEELEKQLAQARLDQANGVEELTQARLRQAAAAEAVKHAQRRLHGARQSQNDYQLAYASWQNKQIKRRTQANALSEINAEIVLIQDLASQALEIATRRQLQLEQQRQSLNSDLTHLRTKLTQMQNQLMQVTEKAHGEQIAVAQSQVRVEQLSEQAQDEFGLQAEEMIAEYGPNQLVPQFSEEEFADDSQENPHPRPTTPYQRQTVEAILELSQRQLQRLGRINPLALEEYRALEERYQFLIGQLNDLQNSKADLIHLVKEVEEQVQQAFVDAYQDVEAAFGEVFQILFPGGEGKLSLTEPDSPLTTGIEVSVRPAGKKVKRLSLLSGGERSLAALAFLFAIFTARPSPFYILDEVEAALDDVNLSRILDLFAAQENRSQLIIITHQKRTMEIAEVLYGITMRNGVSRAISHRMAQAEVLNE